MTFVSLLQLPVTTRKPDCFQQEDTLIWEMRPRKMAQNLICCEARHSEEWTAAPGHSDISSARQQLVALPHRARPAFSVPQKWMQQTFTL